MKIKITEWMYEDGMTETDMYNAIFPLSKVDGVRLFPKTIEIVDDTILKTINTGDGK